MKTKEKLAIAGAIIAGALLAIWYYFTTQKTSGEMTGEIEGETTISVEPIT